MRLHHAIPLLLAIIALSSCAPQPLPSVRLPVAPHAPSPWDRPARTAHVTLASGTEVWLGNTLTSTNELRQRLETMPDVPLVIRADRDRPFSTVWRLVYQWIPPGDRRPLAFRVLTDRTEAEERDLPWRRVAAVAYDAPPSMVTMAREGDRILLNDKALAREEADRILAKLASYSREQTILVKAGEKESLQDVIDLLDLLEKHSLENGQLALVGEWPQSLLEDLEITE